MIEFFLTKKQVQLSLERWTVYILLRIVKQFYTSKVPTSFSYKSFENSVVELEK